MVSTEQKAGLQALLARHLSLDDKGASDLMLASSHLLRAGALAPKEVPAVLARSADRFTPYHLETLQTILRGAAQLEPPATAAQQALIDAVDAFFARRAQQQTGKSWAA